MKKGDRVEVVNYGSKSFCTKEEWDRMFKAKQVETEIPEHLISMSGDGKNICYDWRPELVGEVATIVRVVDKNGRTEYTLDIDSKVAPYFEDQLKLIE